jgi:LDH2 family malate/lactate/ureidoglycolate dehydrogenase
MPLAGYKGSGLALVLGLLGGPLNRAAFGRDVKDVAAEQVQETNTGHFVVALDVKRFLPLDVFKAEIDRHIRDLASSQRLPGVDEIRIPGQGRIARRADREKNGVPLAAPLLKQVDEVAASLGITPLTAR